MNTPAGDAVAALTAVLGADAVRTDADALAGRLVDHRRLYEGRALAVVLPRTTQEVAAVLACCDERRVGVVPQGGNTSYCGGATPDASGTQLLLSLDRLNRIRRVDADDYALIAEAGCRLADVQRAAETVDRLFPLSLGSEGSCQIGGNLSTNAGGTNVLRYGMARDLVLGLEVVLAGGRVLETLSTLRKDNTGYDLRHLFIGAEGTLGVITAASLRLFPRPRQSVTAFVAVPDVARAIELLSRLRTASADRVGAFELVPALAVELVLRHLPGMTSPLPAGSPLFVLVEIDSPNDDEDLQQPFEAALASAIDAGLATDAAIAQSGRERAALWALRESIPEAQRRDGASLKHDVSLPVSALAAFHSRAAAWVAANVPEGRLVAYGHLGDGNLHFNLNQAPGASSEAFLAREAQLRRAIHDLAHELGGSFSAEHGIGRSKVAELRRYASPVELQLMHTIKRALDPHGIMNPGKVLA